MCPLDGDMRRGLDGAIEQIEDSMCRALGINPDLARAGSAIRDGTQAWAQSNLIIGGSEWSPLSDIYAAYSSETRHPVSQKRFASMLADAGVQRRIQTEPDGRRRRLWHMRLRTAPHDPSP